MKLQNNPFFILGLPCSSGRREIVAAAEELSFLLDADTCSNAQNELINLNKRLSAELGWFLDAEKADIQAIQEAVNNNNPILTDGLSSLSKLNATLYNFSISGEEDPYELGYSILDIDEQYSALDYSEIASEVNRNRTIAKISGVQENDISEELNKKRDDIRQAISDRLSKLDQDTYVELITMLAEKCIADDEYEDGIVLSDVVDQYEVNIQAQLEESTERIEKHIDHIQHLVNDEAIGDNIKTLIIQVQNWDKIAQPLQLKSQASGMPHENSEHLGIQLRNLALHLHNEKGKTQEALSLVNAMKDVFAELGNLSDLFNSDSDALNDLIQGEKDAKAVLAEMNVLQQQSESLKSFATSTSVSAFVDRVKKLDAKLKSLDLDAETRTNVRENLCLLARGTAIELHNTKHDTANALIIAKALQTEFGDMPSLRVKLAEDVTALNQQLLLSFRQPATTRTYGSPSSSSSSSKNPGCLVGIIIAVVLIIIIAVSSGGGSSSSSSSNTTSKPTTSYSNNSGSSKTPSTQKSNNSSSSYSTNQSNKQAELDRLKTQIESMESKLSLMQIEINNYESDLDDLSDDIDSYEAQYYATGNEYYYNAYYDAVDEYNSIYEEYSDKIDEYNALYDKYSDAVDEYNSKISY